MVQYSICRTRFIFALKGLLLLLLIASCNTSNAASPTPSLLISSPVQISSPTSVPLSPQTSATLIADALTPKIGTIMAWADGSTIVYVPEGEFGMGKTEKNPSDHSPAHTVNLTGFWIQQTEVTNAMFSRCVEAGVCTDPTQEKGFSFWYENANNANYPVVGVDWNQASAYCGWIGGMLPTEAQWEKAARGTESAAYPWGNDVPACTLANYKDCLKPNQPAPVHTYPDGDSLYKAADMAGNVFEWVNDRYSDTYYSVSPASDPAGPDTGETRVIRGSSFLTKTENMSIVLRNSLKPTQHRVDIGFRCVLSDDAVKHPPAQACTASGYTTTTGVSETPEPWDMTVASAYCVLEADGVTQTGYVKLQYIQTSDIAWHVDDFTSSAGPISLDTSEYKIKKLSGPGIPVDQNFTVEACYPYLHLWGGDSPVSGDCPAGYYQDPVTRICHFIQTGNTPDSCGEGSHWQDGVGCVFYQASFQEPKCPANYTEVEVDAMDQECWPVGEQTTNCLEGNYDPTLGCCQIPADVAPVCFWGHTLDPSTNMCLPTPPHDCRSFDLYIPPCEPTPKPPSEKSCNLLNQTQCNARSDCEWVLSAGPGHCTKK